MVAPSQDRLRFSDAFRDSVQSSLKEVLGDSGSRAVFHHLGPLDYDDVEGFHAKLRAIFGTGALVLEMAIVQHLAVRIDVPVSTLRPDDIVKSASLARASTERRRKA